MFSKLKRNTLVFTFDMQNKESFKIKCQNYFKRFIFFPEKSYLNSTLSIYFKTKLSIL